MKENAGSCSCAAWLASACMPSAVLCDLLDLYGDPASVYRAFLLHDQAIRDAVTPRFMRLLEEKAADESLQRYEKRMQMHRINSFCITDSVYPEALRTINDPPAILFYQGQLSALRERSVAMVGSRAASYTGQKAARKLSEDLSRNKISVISGLACGIDASAHRGCLDGGTPTVAVTGGGLDIVYPRENTTMRDEIIQKGGLILSEYAPGERPIGWHFPVRNRIITGLAKALILIEARIRSGSMISVRHALDQGKDVFVYPGDPSSVYFEGNHQLLREGGIYFTCADDILEDLHWLDNPVRVGQNSDCLTGQQSYSPEEQSIIRALQPGVMHFEELLSKTGLEAPALMTGLTMLQIAGRVEALPGKQYQLTH